MVSHKTLVKKMLKRPAVKAEYDAQAEEFALVDELLKADTGKPRAGRAGRSKRGVRFGRVLTAG